MHDAQPHAYDAVTLLGDGPAEPDDVTRAYRLAPTIVAADGGAKHAHSLGLPIKHIVGDLDSLTSHELWRKSGTKIHRIPEQDSTDFEKCLYTIHADFYLGVGFLGQRLDHSLACLSALVSNRDRAVLLLGETDVVFHVPERFGLDLAAATRVSLYPMLPVRGIGSEGLRWPIAGLDFAPGRRIGTSNAALGGRMSVELDGPGMLMILPARHLEAVAAALRSSAG